MQVEIRWTRLALADLRSIHAWLCERDADAARRWADSTKRAVSLLARFPYMGPEAPDLEPRGRYRHLIRGWHRIIYRVEDKTAFVLRVWDCRRNPTDLTPIE